LVQLGSNFVFSPKVI